MHGHECLDVINLNLWRIIFGIILIEFGISDFEGANKLLHASKKFCRTFSFPSPVTAPS
jgi:hypothetical protein